MFFTKFGTITIFDRGASARYFEFAQNLIYKETQMQDKISMALLLCQSENGFSLDELVTKLTDGYKRKAFAELLKMIL